MNKIPKALLFENEEAKPLIYDLKLFTINIYNWIVNMSTVSTLALFTG